MDHLTSLILLSTILSNSLQSIIRISGPNPLENPITRVSRSLKNNSGLFGDYEVLNPDGNEDYKDSVDSNLRDACLLLVSNSGEIIRVKTSSKDLRTESYFNEADQIVSAYVSGIWVFYSEPNFNWKDGAEVVGSSVEWIFSPNEPKLHAFKFKIQSFRPAGNSSNFRSSTVTLYLGKNYTGPDLLVPDSQYPDMPYSKSKSLIITGNEPWFMFTQANFVQKTICVVAVDGLAMIPDFYLKNKTRPLRHISSVWKGGCVPTKAKNLYYGEGDR